jgi:hypothetical protein
MYNDLLILCHFHFPVSLSVIFPLPSSSFSVSLHPLGRIFACQNRGLRSHSPLTLNIIHYAQLSCLSLPAHLSKVFFPSLEICCFKNRPREVLTLNNGYFLKIQKLQYYTVYCKPHYWQVKFRAQLTT